MVISNLQVETPRFVFPLICYKGNEFLFLLCHCFIFDFIFFPSSCHQK